MQKAIEKTTIKDGKEETELLKFDNEVKMTEFI